LLRAKRDVQHADVKLLTILEVALASAALVVWGLLSGPVVAHADTCNDGAAKRGTSGSDYYLCQGGVWLHVMPTFDPNSADGYGPNQPLPPLCIRFPDQYSCPQ
jgi:hypothetical protein